MVNKVTKTMAFNLFQFNSWSNQSNVWNTFFNIIDQFNPYITCDNTKFHFRIRHEQFWILMTVSQKHPSDEPSFFISLSKWTPFLYKPKIIKYLACLACEQFLLCFWNGNLNDNLETFDSKIEINISSVKK